MCIFTKFRFHHSHETAHCSPLIAHILASLGFNCNKGRHFHLITNSQQLGHSPSLNYILVCHQTMMPIPTSKFSKTMRRNPTTPTVYHKNKGGSTGLMNGYYVVEVTIIIYPTILCMNFYASWIMITTSLSTLQHLSTRRSCDYLSLSVLLNTSSDAIVVFILMFRNANL